MSKKRWKGLSLALIAAMLFSLVPAAVLPAAAAEGDVVYDFENGLQGFEAVTGWGDNFYSDSAGVKAASLNRSADNQGALQLNAKLTGGGWDVMHFGVRFASTLDLSTYGSAEYEVLVPLANWKSGVLKTKAELNEPYASFINDKDLDVLAAGTEKVQIGGGEYARFLVKQDIDVKTAHAQLVFKLAGSGSTYTGPIYIDNVKLSKKTAAPVGGTAKELKTFAFDSSVEGWSTSADHAYQAEFGEPLIAHSKELGGALQINAKITDPTKDWQELRVGVDVPELKNAKQVSFDMLLPLDQLDDKYEGSTLNPYIVLDPEWSKQGMDSNKKVISDLEKVNVDGKTYAKLSANVKFSVEGKSKLYIGFVSSKLAYTGPIYIDNVKLLEDGATSVFVPQVIPNNKQSVIDTKNFDLSDVDLVDSNANAATRSLFAYMKGISGKYMLFGHQHATTQGLTITVGDGTQSDVKNAVGAFPAVYGWDTLSLEGKEEPGTTDKTMKQNADALADVMKKAYERNGILTLSAHMPNFVTGGGTWDTTPAVKQVLPGGVKNGEYTKFLDMIADFANNLKDDNGQAIPVIFRPLHENTGDWFWWGAPFSSASEYKNLFRYTVEYLRDVKGVRNFLYSYSPSNNYNGIEDFLTRYPGDEYVDILGFDAYDGNYTEGWMDGLVDDAKTIAKYAEEHGKLAAITETGLAQDGGGVIISGNRNPNWFTMLLDKIKADPDARKMTYMLTWRNGNDHHFWVPYRNHTVHGSNEMLDDFTTFYNDDFTAFNDRLAGVYTLKVKAKAEQSSMYILSPTDKQKIDGVNKVRVSVSGQQPTKVVYTVGGVETELVKAQSGYYEGDWQPTAEQNGKVQELTVKAAFADGSSLVEKISVKVFAAAPLFTYTFDKDAANASYEGAWQAAGSVSGNVEHTTAVGGGAVQVNVSFEDDAVKDNWTYQELKVKLPSMNQLIDINKLSRIQYDILLPADAPDSVFKPYGILYTTDGEGYVKVGEGMTEVKKADFTKQEDGMLKYTVSFETGDRPTATDLVIGFVANDWNYKGPIYIDNVQLINQAKEPQADPSVVDTFDGYDGDSTMLGAAYSSNGDAVKLSLTDKNVKEGKLGLQYDYALGANGYGGRIKLVSASGADWSSFNALRFWLTPDGHNQKLVLQIKANNVSFEVYPSLADSTQRLEEIPFSEFHVAPWDTANAGKKLDAEMLKKVQQFAIYVNAVDGKQLSSTLYFDDIRAVKIEEQKPEVSFTDVPSEHWAASAISKLAAKQVVKGYSNGGFEPLKQVTRAEFVSMIARALGLKATKSSPFSDVLESNWFAQDVAAAYEAGIVSGRTATEFAPNEKITRQEMAVIVMRAYEMKFGQVTVDEGLLSFADADQISPFAKAAVQKARMREVIQGKGNNQFVPQANATRAEAAVVLQVFVN